MYGLNVQLDYCDINWKMKDKCMYNHLPSILVYASEISMKPKAQFRSQVQTVKAGVKIDLSTGVLDGFQDIAKC